MLIYLRILKESFSFAVNALKNNKLRTFLSLLGVTIGIFSIIGVLAAVDSLQKNISDNLSVLDKSTIYLFNRSFGPTEIPRWKVQQFPKVTWEEYQRLERSVPDMQAITYTMFVGSEAIRHEGQVVDNARVTPVTEVFPQIERLQFDSGRFFNGSESMAGAPVVIIGYEIAENLFGNGQSAIGKKVRMYGQRLTVIGVLKKEGTSFFGDSADTKAYIPVVFMRKILGDNNNTAFPAMILKPEKGVDQAAFVAMLKQKMRQIRGLKPDEIDNFFVNQFSGFTDFIDGIIGTMQIIGGIISSFSLLVGGFGIANIMFVSVKERTNLIGIQKSLGAKNRFILLQFLFEGVILAVIGGAVGLILVWITSLIASGFTESFEFILSPANIIFGTFVSVFIGLIAGIIPAISASRLDPVEAIRTGM
ncbi:ABC transporter permease [Gangjinia marincola]|uniref:ABC transporter permease n=1 Tax=Gangjinia marincola TaxID=578463 RepID=A0ABP3XSN0_9FLAO